MTPFWKWQFQKWFWNQCEPVQNRRTSVSQTGGCPVSQSIPQGSVAGLLTHAAVWKSTHLWSLFVGPFCVGSADAHFLQDWGHLSKYSSKNTTKSQSKVKLQCHVGICAYLSHFKSNMYNSAVKTSGLVISIALETVSLLHLLSAGDVQKLIWLVVCSTDKCKKYSQSTVNFF